MGFQDQEGSNDGAVNRTPSPADLWPIYGRHAAAILGRGPTPDAAAGTGWSLAVSGANHVDLNQAMLYAPVTRADAELVAARVLAAGVPILLAQSAGLEVEVSDLLGRAGLLRSPGEEALFWAAQAPARTGSPFEVRRAVSRADLEGIWSIFADVHGYEPDLIQSMYGEALLENPEVQPWLALDGIEPVSCAFITVVGRTLGLFDVMTPSRHRRRGAARALLGTALSSSAGEREGGIDGILFWASPFGRPLYASLGFSIADLVTAWTLGASAEDLAAVGAG